MLNKLSRHLVDGRTAETVAKKYLCKKGLKLIKKNYATKSGEIDLVMADGNTIVFVEVRYRQNIRFGLPEETVSLSKQRKIIKAAQHYLMQHRLTDDCECRFDIVAIHGTISKPDINWISDAFYAQT